MVEVAVERDPHIDALDEVALLQEIRALGYDAEATGQQTILEAPWWVLVLHIIEYGADVEVVIDSLGHLARIAYDHFRSRLKEPPRYIHLYGPDGEMLSSLEVYRVD